MSTETTTTVPVNDDRVTAAEALGRARELFAHALTLPAEDRKVFTDRAFALLAKHYAAKWEVPGELDRQPRVFELPTYGTAGQGTVRYTKQRAALLVKLADTLGGVAELVYTGYSYPKPESKRRHYFVNVWAIQPDMDRIATAFEGLEKLVLADAYTETIVPMADLKSAPAQQTRRRRQWLIDTIDTIVAALGEVADTAAEKRHTDGNISDRQTVAGKARDAHHNVVGDRETVENTAE